jgi:hypothetical protein
LWRTTPPNEERGSGWWRTWAKRESFTAADWQNLAERLGQPDMAAALEYRVKNVRRGRPGTRQAPWTPESGDELVPIYLGQVGWGNPRRFGDVYVALRFWKRLGLGNLVSKLVTGRSSEVNALVCAMMVANRLVSPESELGMLGWWGKTSLPELLGLPVESVDDHRLYRSLDAILPHKERIEERLILVRSAGCAIKEKGIHDRLVSRMAQDLDRLRERVERGALVVPAKIERAVGRIQERYPGISRWVNVEVRRADGKAEVVWQLKEEVARESRESEGVYLLRTNLPADSAEDVWRGYMTLTRVEAAFRSLKQELRLRPVFHQKGDRVEAHILLSYIAYALLWSIEHTHRQHGGTLTGRRALDVLSGIEMGTITLRAGDGRKLELERISTPRPEEAMVLSTLGIQLPRQPRNNHRADWQLSLIENGDKTPR